ncbi:spermine synthase [cyanobacterium endosymbiont of Rhopalodia gibberula]|uniref:spermine/spermidine synthase domain-containing protein n=1 Tax=cyanobacterium endosymbiont of Rhopalodia gibberula TaxID=1763363 RepID=UPI000DC6F880|nr:spermidine synthase [cyanobacterium endosymbiont of Rhopalodia gibberula]BBA79612.1 spermine synthase [cyanobacterium endosymbiont of Rhopalodia gibberula]
MTSAQEHQPALWMNEYITPWDLYIHGINQILAHTITPYHEMYIVETEAYGKALILDGRWQSCSIDEFIYHEALVHPAMISYRSPKNVLILGGSEGATLREVLRWKNVEKVWMINPDGEVVEACRQNLVEMHQNAFDDPRVELTITDPLSILETTSKQWDIIISDLIEPINKRVSCSLFTQDYFKKLRQVLSPGGFMMVQAGSVAPAELDTHIRLINTLRTVFPWVNSISNCIPANGYFLGFALCSEHSVNIRPNPTIVDQLLAEKTTGGLRFIDGKTLLGIFQTPTYVRHAIETKT